MVSEVVGPTGKLFALESTAWGKQNGHASKSGISGLGNVSPDLPPLGAFELAHEVDHVLTVHNYHDPHTPGYAKIDMSVCTRRVYDALNPGGVYFILDHAAAPGTGATLSPKLHRIDKQTVIDEVTEAGFKLVGESDILKN